MGHQKICAYAHLRQGTMPAQHSYSYIFAKSDLITFPIPRSKRQKMSAPIEPEILLLLCLWQKCKMGRTFSITCLHEDGWERFHPCGWPDQLSLLYRYCNSAPRQFSLWLNDFLRTSKVSKEKTARHSESSLLAQNAWWLLFRPILLDCYDTKNNSAALGRRLV